MKVAIGFQIKKKGPWGGGIQFANNITKFLSDRNIKTVDHLRDDDIDIILLTDPRPKSKSASFNHFDAEKYKLKKKNTIVILRVNECDERKGTTDINFYINQASHVCDHIIYISNWLKRVHNINKESTVILNGADKKVFNSYGNLKEDLRKFKIVTHHWSSNYNKGFKYYLYLDNLLNKPFFKDIFSFTYIGNLSEKFKFQNTKVIKPLSGEELGKKISEHDIYLTGSVNEPGGNHQNEGLNCGLPVLYIGSGCMPEYCYGFGEEFNDYKSFEQKLILIKDNYKNYYENCKNYPYNSNLTCQKYAELFEFILTKNIELIKEKSMFSYKTSDKIKFYFKKFF